MSTSIRPAHVVRDAARQHRLFHVVNRTTENILGTGVVQPTSSGPKSPAQAEEVGGLMEAVRVRLGDLECLLRGLDSKCPGDVRDLVVLLLDVCGEFGGATHIDNLSGCSQSRCDRGVGRDHGLDIGRDALAQRI